MPLPTAVLPRVSRAKKSSNNVSVPKECGNGQAVQRVGEHIAQVGAADVANNPPTSSASAKCVVAGLSSPLTLA